LIRREFGSRGGLVCRSLNFVRAGFGGSRVCGSVERARERHKQIAIFLTLGLPGKPQAFQSAIAEILKQHDFSWSNPFDEF
jgi:hypothetical protein